MNARWFLLTLFVLLLVSVTAVLAAAQPVACAGAPVPRLVVGTVARPAQVFSSLRAALDSNDVLQVLFRADGDQFKILDGPRCGSGPHNWYKVDYKGTVGWVTEGQGSTYWVEPAPAAPPTPTLTPIPAATPVKVGPCAGAPAPRLTVGTLARPAQVFSSLRAALDSNDVLKVLLKANGDTFTVQEGPLCGTGPHNWYKVSYKGTVGWVTEGTGSTYWVEPVPR